MLPRRFAELPVEMQNESVSPILSCFRKAKAALFRRAAELPLALFCWRSAAVDGLHRGGRLLRQPRGSDLPSDEGDRPRPALHHL